MLEYHREKGVDQTYTAQDLMQAAKQSVATIGPAKELILRGLCIDD